MQNKEQKEFSQQELLRYLQNAEKQVILLSAPSNCGKTQLIRQLTEAGEGVVRLSGEAFVSSLLEGLRSGRRTDLLGGVAEKLYICIEDLDWYGGRPNTELALADWITELAEKAVVIVTGIALEQRMSALCSRISDCRLFEKNAPGDNWRRRLTPYTE